METKKMKKEDIVNYCNKLGIQIDNNVIKTCDSDTITELYISLLEQTSLLKSESLSIEFSAFNKQIFQFTGLHDKIIRKLKLIRFMKAFLSSLCNYSSFSSADIFSPVPKKTKVILNHIISFIKHLSQMKDKFISLKALYLQSQTEYNATVKLHNDAQAQFEKTVKEIEEAKQEIERMGNEVSVFQNENATLKTKVISSEQDITEKKVSLADVEKKIELVDDMYRNCSIKMNGMKTQIVSSSCEELGIVIKEKENAICNLNKEIEEKNVMIKKMNSIESYYKNIQEMIDEYVVSMEGNEKMKNEEEVIMKAFETKKEVIGTKKKMLEDNKSKVNVLIEQSETLDNYLLSKLSEDKEKKENELKEIINKYNEINKNKESVLKEYNEQNAKVEKIEKDFMELETIKQYVENQVLQEMDEMYKAASEYCDNFTKLLTQYEQGNQEQNSSL